jgi:hypothetical protein
MKRDGEMRVRLANEQDIPVLREVIDASVRGLQAEDYSAPKRLAGIIVVVVVWRLRRGYAKSVGLRPIRLKSWRGEPPMMRIKA